MFHLRHSYLVMLLVVASVSACRPAVQGGDAVASRSVEAGNVNSIQTLSQGWTNKDARWFYNIPQGSRLIPYDWFLHLERADGTTALRSADNIRRLGYLPRTTSDDNPDGLPIGFTKDKGTDGDWLGFTCAACHTAQINYDGKGYLV